MSHNGHWILCRSGDSRGAHPSVPRGSGVAGAGAAGGGPAAGGGGHCHVGGGEGSSPLLHVRGSLLEISLVKMCCIAFWYWCLFAVGGILTFDYVFLWTHQSLQFKFNQIYSYRWKGLHLTNSDASKKISLKLMNRIKKWSFITWLPGSRFWSPRNNFLYWAHLHIFAMAVLMFAICHPFLLVSVIWHQS